MQYTVFFNCRRALVSLSKQLELDQAKSKFDITVRKKQKLNFTFYCLRRKQLQVQLSVNV
jgi:hypothetical protein